MLTGVAVADNPESEPRIAAFREELQELGWTDGRNVRIDYRSGLGHAASIRKYAAELDTLAADVILASGTATIASMLQATRTVPIVFVYSSIRSVPTSHLTGGRLFYGWNEGLERLKAAAARLAL